MKHTFLMDFKSNKLMKRYYNFCENHPLISFLTLMVGLPAFILGAVLFCSSLIILPIAMAFGWA